ncbi:MAG: hypothetical protein LQ338_007082 [Usnochroma carphineum]|nr:MAG: hypothetical protein LQ338_007082 [Usnochroma carphineum]
MGARGASCVRHPPPPPSPCVKKFPTIHIDLTNLELCTDRNARDFLKDYWDSIGGKPSSSFSSSSSSVPPPQAKRGRGKPPSISRNKDGLIFPGLADRTTPPRSNGSSDATGGKGQRDQAAAGAMPQAGRDKTDEGFGVAE